MLVKEKLYKNNIKFKRVPFNGTTICEQNNCPHRVVEGYKNPICKVCDYLLKRSRLINLLATPRLFYYIPDPQC